MPPKILYFDIETFPLMAHVWSKFVDGSVIAVEREWTIASIAWKWEHQKRVHGLDCRGHVHDDTLLLTKLWDLFDEADVVIGHNLDKFDVKKVNARFLLEGYPPPSPYQTIDTLKEIRKVAALTSNRLGDVCHQLGIGDKVSTGGFELWLGCLEDQRWAWDKMMRYNKQDVALLPELYKRIRPWMKTHPVLHDTGCHTCGSHNVQKRGTRRTRTGSEYQQYQCNACLSYFREPTRTSASEYRA